MNKFNVLITTILFAISCNNNENHKDKSQKSLDKEGTYEDTSNIDYSIKLLVKKTFAKYDTAIVFYSPVCWIEDCAKKGFIFTKQEGRYDLSLFRLRRLYQRYPLGDTCLYVGSLMEMDQHIIPSDVLILSDSAIKELETTTIPKYGINISDHDQTIYLWIKMGKINKRLITHSAALSYINPVSSVFLFRLDTTLFNSFGNSNNVDTIAR